MERRDFLMGAAACGALLVGGAIVPAWAGDGAAAAFAANSEDEVLARLFPGLTARPSDAVDLIAPYLATPGQAIMVRAAYRREPAQGIAITAPDAERPLVALAVLQRSAGVFGLRLRLQRSSPVVAYVLSESGLYSATRRIKVTRGGYGMGFGRLEKKGG
ncbi:thiosulfate oxidation carrier protein SoxY [Pelagibius marinus]|uniref:thiosulfate oxidation carrier protein SoxY n=1 Tax=Pelagibius marinus TaxID=2762760 RepID=UPI0018730999|nr:thiosulfate oxidation carrier protein SoxY [Pelagibius marinus]